MITHNNGLLMRHAALLILTLWALGPRLTSAPDPRAFGLPEEKVLPTVHKIFIIGGRHVKDDVIASRLPYEEGELFDENLSREAITSLASLGYFNTIDIKKHVISDNLVNVYVFVEENKLLEAVEFEGNKAISDADLCEKLGVAKVETINDEFIANFKRLIRKVYADEGYHQIDISARMIVDDCNPDKARICFTICEGLQTKINCIEFVGNEHIPSYRLRSIMLTQEWWIMSLLSKSGIFNPELLEMDLQRLPHYYREFGYLNAKIAHHEVDYSDDRSYVNIKICIDEGSQYFIRCLDAIGDDIHSKKDMLDLVTLKSGEPFVQSKLVNSMERIKDLYGDDGYINSDVYPQVLPDESNCQVDITFEVDRGERVCVNRIDITGNVSVKDKLIRRRIAIEEGDMITSDKLTRSQDAVEFMSLFERGGVNWKIHHISENVANLELNVREAKTGSLSLKGTYGSTENANKRAFKLGVEFNQLNFMGEGWDIGAQAQFQLARHGAQYFDLHLANADTFQTNVASRFAAYHTKQEYDEWHNINATPEIRESGGYASAGFFLPSIDKRLEVEFEVGAEYLRSNTLRALPQGEVITLENDLGFPVPSIVEDVDETETLQTILDELFADSHIQWFALSLIKDTRNHLIYPNKGYKLYWTNKIAIPQFNDAYGYWKTEVDASYYTALIGADALVLMLHGRFGAMLGIAGKGIPYKELYHMGGQQTVRGFKFGQIGPSWKNQDPLGGRYAVQFNSELIFPLMSDFSMKGHLFYDAGAGWSFPTSNLKVPSLVRRNKFTVRHAVGFGINLLRPTSAKIDWGYKLDRDRDRNESSHEFHISMNMAW